jgi:hypothetical protein
MYLGCEKLQWPNKILSIKAIIQQLHSLNKAIVIASEWLWAMGIQAESNLSSHLQEGIYLFSKWVNIIPASASKEYTRLFY